MHPNWVTAPNVIALGQTIRMYSSPKNWVR